MKQEFIGNTSIEKSNETINFFMKTSGIDYFEDDISLQKVVENIKALGFVFDIDECEVCISGESLKPTNIPTFAHTTKEALFIAVETFSKLKINNHI